MTLLRSASCKCSGSRARNGNCSARSSAETLPPSDTRKVVVAAASPRGYPRGLFVVAPILLNTVPIQPGGRQMTAVCSRLAALSAALILCIAASDPASAQKKYDPGASDTEI